MRNVYFLVRAQRHKKMESEYEESGSENEPEIEWILQVSGVLTESKKECFYAMLILMKRFYQIHHEPHAMYTVPVSVKISWIPIDIDPLLALHTLWDCREILNWYIDNFRFTLSRLAFGIRRHEKLKIWKMLWVLRWMPVDLIREISYFV